MAITSWGYPNGQIPLNKMYGFTSRGVTYYLREDAAYWWWRLATAFGEATGVSLEIVDAYRTLDEQWYYWNRYINRLPGWTIASQPGYSNHGWAMAVDIYGPSYGGSTSSHLHAWLRANAPAYGWTWNTGQASGEPWHWEFTNTPTIPAGEKPTPIPKTIHPKDRRKPMFGFIRNPKTTAIAIVYGDGPNAGRKRHLKYGEWAAFEAQGWKFKEVKPEQFDAVPDVS